MSTSYDPSELNIIKSEVVLGGLSIPRKTIRECCLRNGYKLKDQGNGVMDLNPYVYDAFVDLIETVMEMKVVILD